MMWKLLAAGLFTLGCVLAGACADETADESASPTFARPLSTTPTPPRTPTTTPTAGSTPTATSTPLVEVTGLFIEPAASSPAVARPLGPRPTSVFAPWDGESSILYDAVTGTEMNLGPGMAGRFSPDARRMAWAMGTTFLSGEVLLLDLETMEERPLGAGRLVAWVDNNRLAIGVGNNTEILDLTTGERTFVEGLPYFQPSDTATTPDGYALRKQYASDYPFGLSRFTLTNPATGELLLAFAAYEAVPAGRGWLAVATEVQYAGPVLVHGFQDGTVNIFLVSIETGESAFIATSTWAQPNWPLVANERYVAWTESYCSVDPGGTRLYDRSTRTTYDLGGSFSARRVHERRPARCR